MAYNGKYPEFNGLGLGASPGSTAGLTFDGSNFMDNYAVGIWTPTLDGAVSGTTTYTTQVGYYTRIGNIVFFTATIVITAATGTGNAHLGGLPFTVKNQTNGNTTTAINLSSTTWTWPALSTELTFSPQSNTTFGLIVGTGTGLASANLQMNNSACNVAVTGMFTV